MGYAFIIPTEDFSKYKHTRQVNPVKKCVPTAIKIVGSPTLNDTSDQGKYSVRFTPLLSSIRNVTWEITDGSAYASIGEKTGLLSAKYTGTKDPHDVTIKASVKVSESVSITDTMVVSVICNYEPKDDDVLDFSFNLERPQKGEKLMLVGTINNEESAMVRFNQPTVGDTTASAPSALTGITLVDNLDGTATVTIETDEYNHQVKFTAYNAARTTVIKSHTININDFVIINAADSQNSEDLMAVLHNEETGTMLAAASDKMWQSEAYVVTSL